MITKEYIQQDALAALAPHKRASVNISMGVGKTLIGLQHMAQNYTDTAMFLVVAPKVSILQSWIDDAKKFNLEYLLDHIIFTTYISMHKHGTLYDVVYLDECHSLKFSHTNWLSSYKGGIIGLTGTAPKIKSSEKGKMIETYCPVVYEYKPDDAVDDSILNDYEIIVHMLSLSTTKTYYQKTRNGNFPTSELKSYNYWCEKILNTDKPSELQLFRILRMKALMSYPSKDAYAKKLFNSSKEKIILFGNTTEQVDKICTHTYHTKNKDSNINLAKFKSGEIKKLGCVLQLSEGVNIPDLKEGIIMHAYGNERKSAQRLGRLLRLNPDDKATLHILCYKDTVDEQWVNKALEGYDLSKIKKVTVS
jgi:superfamily II DNA or RNA helicase